MNKKFIGLLSALLAFSLVGCNANSASKVESTGTSSTAGGTQTGQSTSNSSTSSSTTVVVETKYDCTITTSEDGTIVSDKTSAKVGEDVVLTITPNTDVALLGIVVNDTTVYEADLTKDGAKYTYTTKMVENGLTVSAQFINDAASVELTLSSHDENSLKKYASELITLPTATAATAQNANVSSFIKVVDVTDPNAIISNSQITSDVTGKHTIKYTVEHPITKKVMNEKTLEVVFARKIFNRHDNTYSVQNEFDNDENQVVASTNGGFALSQFAFTPCETYYTEVTIDRATADHYAFGIGHYADTSNMDEQLLMAVEGNDNNFKVKKFVTSGDGAWSLGDGTLDYLNYQLHNYRGVAMEQGASTYTMQVARIGYTFYLFINNSYVTQFSYAAYNGVASVPGIFMYNPKTGITCKNIVYETNADKVNEKLASLLNNGTAQIGAYSAAGASWAAGSLAEGNFKVNEYNETRGLNFDFLKNTTDHNDGMVSLYQWFDGDFTYEFDYKPTSLGNVESIMWLELRYGPYYSEGMWLGTKFGGAEVVDLNSAVIEQMMHDKTQTPAKESWANQGVTDFSEGFHYKLERKVNGIEAHYTMTVNSIKTPTQVKTVSYDNTLIQKVVVLWHNKGVAGEYSNLTWKTSVE